jgi:hypothetical protein
VAQASSLVRILGCGPAGSTAALSALKHGAEVEIIERSSFPRHKVCGEFLSPEIAPILASLDACDAFLASRPHRVTHMSLIFGSRTKSARLPEPAYGLSRYTFDNLLRDIALSRGARSASEGEPHIITTGRSATMTRGGRLFGFKAHYEGPQNDAVELYFLRRAYIGISCVEGRVTNVCGLAPEDMLNRHGFDPDSLMQSSDALRDRLKPLNRRMKWLFTGPLEYGQQWQNTDCHRAGDALSFVDPARWRASTRHW